MEKVITIKTDSKGKEIFEDAINNKLLAMKIRRKEHTILAQFPLTPSECFKSTKK